MGQLSPRLVLATHNDDKVRELRALLQELVPALGPVVSVGELLRQGLGDPPEIVEDQPTLEGNAVKKARAVAAWSGVPALADDTGLEVFALGGRPGVCSARYAGPGATYADNRRQLLGELANVADEARAARFRTVVAVAYDPEHVETAEGELRGRITREERGRAGFGYDPIFEIPELGKTLAELTLEEKNRLSHRGRALRAAVPLLERLVTGPAR